MWKKKDFVTAIKAKLAVTDEQRAIDAIHSLLPEGVVATYVNEREHREALLWLSGKPVTRDFKIESRCRDGVWRHTLLVGSLGYSAADPLVVIENGETKD